VQGSYTFSSLSVTGGGLAAVTAAAISAPMRHASTLDLRWYREKPFATNRVIQSETRTVKSGRCDVCADGPRVCPRAAQSHNKRSRGTGRRGASGNARLPSLRISAHGGCPRSACSCLWLRRITYENVCCHRLKGQSPASRSPDGVCSHRPGRWTNRESVSPYTTRAAHSGLPLTSRIAFSSVSRPDCRGVNSIRQLNQLSCSTSFSKVRIVFSNTASPYRSRCRSVTRTTPNHLQQPKLAHA